MRNQLIWSDAVMGAVFVLCFAAGTGPAEARRKSCMVDHFHYGSSSGEPSKKAAQAAAIQSWADFTDFEYGSAWSSYRKARSKGMTCVRSGVSWGCKVEAVPCR